MTNGSEFGEAFEVVPAASIERIECPTRAAELGRVLAERSGRGDPDEASELAAALLRGELVIVRRSPPELDDYDGSIVRPLRDLAAAAC